MNGIPVNAWSSIVLEFDILLLDKVFEPKLMTCDTASTTLSHEEQRDESKTIDGPKFLDSTATPLEKFDQDS